MALLASKASSRLILGLACLLAPVVPTTELQANEAKKSEPASGGKQKTPSISLLQFRVSPSIYFQLPDEANGIPGASSLTTTLAWAPSFKINKRFYVRAQADVTPLNTISGLTFAPGVSAGGMYRFTGAWAVEVDGGAQILSVGAWPTVRALALFSPKGFGLSPKIPIRFHAGYQPLLGAVITHGAVMGVEIAFL